MKYIFIKQNLIIIKAKLINYERKHIPLPLSWAKQIFSALSTYSKGSQFCHERSQIQIKKKYNQLTNTLDEKATVEECSRCNKKVRWMVLPSNFCALANPIIYHIRSVVKRCFYFIFHLWRRRSLLLLLLFLFLYIFHIWLLIPTRLQSCVSHDIPLTNTFVCFHIKILMFYMFRVNKLLVLYIHWQRKLVYSVVFFPLTPTFSFVRLFNRKGWHTFDMKIMVILTSFLNKSLLFRFKLSAMNYSNTQNQ